MKNKGKLFLAIFVIMCIMFGGYSVNAENNTVKDNTTKIEKEDKKFENKKGLSNLEIKNLSISPEFNGEVYNYYVKMFGESSEIDIVTEVVDTKYNVEIFGDKNLKEGENLVIVLVTDSKGENVATYQIVVEKHLVDEEKVALEKEKREKMIVYGSGIIIAVLIFIYIVISIVKKHQEKKKKEFEEFEEFEENLEEDEVEEEEINEKDEKEKQLSDLTPEELRDHFLSFYEEEKAEKKSTKRKSKKGKRYK